MKLVTLFIHFFREILLTLAISKLCCQDLYFTSNYELPRGILGPWNSKINKTHTNVISMVKNHSLQRLDEIWVLDHYKQNGTNGTITTHWLAEAKSTEFCPENIPSKYYQ